MKLPAGITREQLGDFVRSRDWYQSFDFLAPFGVKALSDSERKFQALALPRLDGKVVLDLGCNAGYLTFRAIEAGAAVAIGVDYDAGFVRTACAIRDRIKLEPRALFVCSAVESFLESWASSFDVVIGASVAHYLNLPQLLRRFANGAADLIALELPYVPGSDAMHVSRNGEIVIPGEKALETLARARGFAVRKMGESEKLDADERAVFHFTPAAPAAPARGSTARARRAPAPARARARARRRSSS